METWITQLRKGLLEFCLLLLLKEKESYGYEIVQQLKELEELVVTESTVYPILSRLRKDGFLKVRVVPSSDGPERRYFSLTALGRHRIQEMSQYWDELNKSIDQIRLKQVKGESSHE